MPIEIPFSQLRSGWRHIQSQVASWELGDLIGISVEHTRQGTRLTIRLAPDVWQEPGENDPHAGDNPGDNPGENDL